MFFVCDFVLANQDGPTVHCRMFPGTTKVGLEIIMIQVLLELFSGNPMVEMCKKHKDNKTGLCQIVYNLLDLFVAQLLCQKWPQTSSENGVRKRINKIF